MDPDRQTLSASGPTVCTAGWQHGKKWILTERHSPHQGQRSARRELLAVDSSIITKIERPTGGPGTRCGVRQGSEPHCRSCSAAIQGAEIVELPIGSSRAFLRVPPLSPSSWTKRWYTGGNAIGPRVVLRVPSIPSPQT